jgi:dihydroflavonol-4-reductase
MTRSKQKLKEQKTMMNMETDAPVMVTGATGFVAGWIVKALLDAGVTVHAPIRNSHDPAKTQYLLRLADEAPGEIKFFEADLLKQGSYAEAMAGCQIVFHTASPFKADVKDPQKELVDPAVLGTRNVLEEASRVPSVRRVVLTSSCAAMYGDAVDLQKIPNGVVTEDIWNTTSSLQHNPYSYSKTIAEKAAWRLANAQSRWDLIVINPGFVIGPAINLYTQSESFRAVKQMGDGTLRMGAPRFGIGAVDVRDLATAHLAAAFTPAAGGRYIINGYNSDMLGLAKALLPKYGSQYPIPRRAMPKWLVWLVAPIAARGITRRIISGNVDHPWKGDNSRGKRELGVTYRSLGESMNDMFQQMIDSGIVKARGVTASGS